MSNIFQEARVAILHNLETGKASPVEAVTEFEKQTVKLRSGVSYIPPTKIEVTREYANNREMRKRALHSSIPFISPDVPFKLYQGLVLIGGVSGQGKSTASANIIAGFIESTPRKKALILTNEETAEAVYNRIACVILKKNFMEFHRGRLTGKDEKLIEDKAAELMDRVVIDAGTSRYDMTVIEDVQAAFEYAANGEFGIAALDYLQTVTTSRMNPERESVWVSKDLGLFLKQFGREVAIPVVVYAQLKTKDTAKEFKDRIESDRTVFNHAFVAIEASPDFEKQITTFTVWKDRFGLQQGQELEMVYSGGRFVYEREV